MSTLPASVAAGHPATAEVGLAVLAAGGSAGDAAAAMVLAGCVAETLFAGLGGGGFATHFDAATGAVTCLDFFVAVPGLDGTVPAPARSIDVRFGGVPVPYAVGGPSVAVPGTPAGVAELHRRFGSLPWADVVRPARDLAAVGAAFPAPHADLLPEVAPAMMIGAGITAYSRAGLQPDAARVLLAAGEPLFHEGLAATFDNLLDQGPDVLYAGVHGRELVDLARADGAALSPADLDAYRVRELTPHVGEVGGGRLLARGDDLDHFVDTAAGLDAAAVLAGPVPRARALVSALRAPQRRASTTSLVAVDPRGNACAVTHTLGLGSGIWTSGGVHGNSMLGEGELLRGELVPGGRMPSMMVPHVVLDPAGELLLAGGAAGGSRIRPALVQVLAGVLLEGRPVHEVVPAPRLNATPTTVHLEPGFPAEVAAALRADGEDVVEWAARKPYFGGVAAVAADGPAADPRRGGSALRLH